MVIIESVGRDQLVVELTDMHQSENRRASSPVITTLILVSIAIGLAIVIAFWSSGAIVVFQKTEKVDMILSVEPGVQPGTFRFVIQMRNFGTRDATLKGIYLNGEPFLGPNITGFFVSSQDVNQMVPNSITLPIGTVSSIEAELGPKYQAGQALEVLLVTESGSQIRKVIYLQ